MVKACIAICLPSLILSVSVCLKMLNKPYGKLQATFVFLLCFCGVHDNVRTSQCGDCVLAAGDSERSSFTVVSMLMGEVEVGRMPEPLFSSEEDEGKDTTMYFWRGREPPTAPVFPDSSLTSGCKDVGVLGTVLVMGDPDWEELRVIT